MEDITNMFNKILEAEMEIVYENIMQDLIIDFNEETNQVEIKRYED